MGYSCSTKANLVYHEMLKQLKAAGPEDESQNSWRAKGSRYFVELGRSNRDGAMTGRVWGFGQHSTAIPVGTIKVERDGSITRWATSNKAQRKAATTAGLIKFCEIYRSRWQDDEVLTVLVGADAMFVAV